jgi:ABC-type phosphate transport system substrate-binding protein
VTICRPTVGAASSTSLSEERLVLKRAQFLLLAAAVLLAAGAVLLRSTAAAGGEVDVIVNKANTIDDLPLADAKKVFMGDKTTWPSGKRVTILMLAPGQPERTAVLREIYKMADEGYEQYFTQAAFAGKVAAPPKDVASAAQMKQAVAANPGAIGYVKKEDLDDTVKSVLKLQ